MITVSFLVVIDIVRIVQCHKTNKKKKGGRGGGNGIPALSRAAAALHARVRAEPQCVPALRLDGERGEPCELVIGDRNTIREFCTFNIGSPGDVGVTRVGDDNWIMAYVHLAHDCQVGSHTIFANNSQLAGHVHVGDWVILGGFTVVHQFVRLGAHSMTAMCSLLFADLPPFVMSQGQPAEARTMNFEGLRRRGFSVERIAAVKAMHKALYRDNLTLDAAQLQIASLTEKYPESSPDVHMMLSFLKQISPHRGIVR